MSQLEDNAFYKVEITDHSFDETPQGNARINFQCKVISKVRDFGATTQHYSPAEVNCERNFSLVFATEKQREFNVKKLRFAGWRGTDFEDFDMTGQQVIVKNQHQQGDGKHAGKTFDNFDLAMPPMEAADLPKSKQGVNRKLSALLSKALRDNPPIETPNPPADAPQGQTGGELANEAVGSAMSNPELDDVPF